MDVAVVRASTLSVTSVTGGFQQGRRWKKEVQAVLFSVAQLEMKGQDKEPRYAPRRWSQPAGHLLQGLGAVITPVPDSLSFGA